MRLLALWNKSISLFKNNLTNDIGNKSISFFKNNLTNDINEINYFHDSLNPIYPIAIQCVLGIKRIFKVDSCAIMKVYLEPLD